eukprot:m.53933 g.53933  ORF g.53933 m.53933 type:complete len:234 (+) comp6538_c0_seq2:242-943(+)
MAANPLEEAYMQTPLITRTYATACVLTTLACHLDIVTPFQLYLNLYSVFEEYQIWRLITSFLYFGDLGVDFVFHMFFLTRYCRMLEEGSYRGRTADFVVLFLFGMVLMLIAAPIIGQIYLLGQALTFMIVYIWGRRNPNVHMSFLGMFQFDAPYLSYVLLGLSFVLGQNLATDLLGLVVGHIYYFLEDVYAAPPPQGLGGTRVLAAPEFLRKMFDDEPDVQARVEEDWPGGFR